MNNYLHTEFLGNTVLNWLIALGIIFVALVSLYLVKNFAIQQFKKWSGSTNSTLDDFIVTLIEKCLIPYLYFMSIISPTFWLVLSPKATGIFYVIVLLVTTFYILKAINAAVQYFIYSFLQKQEGGEMKKRQAGGIVVILKIIIWVLGIVFLLDNLGYNITTIIAGLGIGGIAIALAAQTFLGDLFSYFAILFDRPFEIGDFITVDDKMGEVEYIGIKTTRLRTVTGEQLICSNRNLTESKVHNFKRLQKRRVLLNLGVNYDTSPETLESIPALLKEVITSKTDVAFDHANFIGFGSYSLNFEIIYYILSADFLLFLDRQQEVNYEIYRLFQSKKITFAFPSQTLFLNHENLPGFKPAPGTIQEDNNELPDEGQA